MEYLITNGKRLNPENLQGPYRIVTTFITSVHSRAKWFDYWKHSMKHTYIHFRLKASKHFHAWYIESRHAMPVHLNGEYWKLACRGYAEHTRIYMSTSTESSYANKMLTWALIAYTFICVYMCLCAFVVLCC